MATQTAQTFEQVHRLHYLLHLPPDYDPTAAKRWPVILFLHGMGERGDNLDMLTGYGIPAVVEQQPEFPFIGVSPQCPDGTVWEHHILELRGLVEATLANYAADPDRVYLTGLSMGGFGTWSLAMTYPDLFAAIAPICGGGRLWFIEAIKQLPAWAFHGDADDVVPLAVGQQMVDALRAIGGDVRFTVYPGVGHDSWTQTYANPELYEWFLSHTRHRAILQAKDRPV